MPLLLYLCLPDIHGEGMLIRKCIRCDKCMGFVIARDITFQGKCPRELCGKCALITKPDDMLAYSEGGHYRCKDK